MLISLFTKCKTEKGQTRDLSRWLRNLNHDQNTRWLSIGFRILSRICVIISLCLNELSLEKNAFFCKLRRKHDFFRINTGLLIQYLVSCITIQVQTLESALKYRKLFLDFRYSVLDQLSSQKLPKRFLR